MYVVSVQLNTLPKKRKECHQTLQWIVDQCSSVNGCSDAHYAIEPGKDNTFQLHMEWNEPEDWQKFNQTNACKALMGMKHLLSSDLQIVSHPTDS